jgi:6-pyruvoyl-tetrahydropterin synthase
MIVNIFKKGEELHCRPPDLITRPVGRTMYEAIRDITSGLSDNETFVLDFAGIKVIDSSFIDEMIVKLILDSMESAKAFYIKLRNFSEITEINIDLVLRSYSNYKNKKIVVITENICHNHVFFIGPLSDKEKDIVEFLRINKSVSCNEVAKFSGLPAHEVQKILEELYSMRAVKKDNDGFFLAV